MQIAALDVISTPSIHTRNAPSAVDGFVLFLIYMTTDDYGLNFVRFGDNWNMLTTNIDDDPGYQDYYIDDIVIATTYEDLDADPVCDSSHLELCTTEEICTGASLNWCDDACQVEECEEPPAAATPLSGVRFSGVRFSM